MKKLILYLLLFLPVVVFAQNTDSDLITQINNNIRNKPYTPQNAANVLTNIVYSKTSLRGIITASGTNTYVASASSAITSYSDQWFLIKFTNANTSGSTLNINLLGAKNIYKGVSTPLESGDIPAGAILPVYYDGVNFQVNISSGGVGSVSGTDAIQITGTPSDPIVGIDNDQLLSDLDLTTAVKSVSGTVVDNADPANPVINVPVYTSSIGITKTGNNFTWGGTVAGDVTLSPDVNNTRNVSIGSIGNRFNQVTIGAGDTGSNSGTFSVTSSTTSMTRTVSNPMSIVMNSSGITVTDLNNNRGMLYAADYSSNYTNRSIPDVGWVNSTKQGLDSDLTTIAGLSPSNDDIIQRKAGAWTNRTMAQLKADLNITGNTVWTAASGTNTYTATINDFTSYNNRVLFATFANANTGASTINVNGLGPIPIKRWEGSGWTDVASGDIRTDRDYRLSYDNTNGHFRLEVIGDAFGTGPLVMGVATNTASKIAPIYGGSDGHVLRNVGGTLGFGPLNLSDPDATTGTLAGYIPLSGGATLTNNLSINGAFNINWGLSGSRMGNFRVWSNGTAAIDGATNVLLQADVSTVSVTPAGITTNTPTMEFNIDTDYRLYNTTNNNFLTQGLAGTGVNLDEVEGTGTFSVNDSDSPLFVVGALGDITFYSVPEYDVAPTLTNDLQVTHKAYVDTKAPLFMQPTTYTSSHVGVYPDDVGTIVYMNVVGANTFTINSGVFPVGTFLNVRVINGATTAVEGAGVTITAQSGSLLLGSSGINVFYQKSADVWELYNGSTFAYSDATLGSNVTITTTGQAWTFTGGDFVATDGTRTMGVDAGSGLQINVGSDATGDIYYRNSSGYLTRLPVGTNGQVLTLASGLPSWAAGGGGVSDGDKGDISVTGGVWTVDNSAITYAKMQNAAGGTRIIGRSAVSSGALNEIVATAQGQILRRDASGLGFGSIDLADADAVGSSVLPIANGGSLSGTYTPTLTNVANLDGSTAYQCQYMRVGNVVTVSGRFDVDITTISTQTQLDISLPIASNFSGAHNAGGTASTVNGIDDHPGIMADATNDRVSVIWNTTSGSAFSMFFSFTYLVQ